MIKTLGIFLFLAGVRSVWLVEPPNNVTIHCQNGTNIAYWNHSGSSTVLFNVVIKSYIPVVIKLSPPNDYTTTERCHWSYQTLAEDLLRPCGVWLDVPAEQNYLLPLGHGTTSQLNTSQHHIDISSITPPRNMEEYTFSVAALEGLDKSDVVPVSFTYARDLRIGQHTCFMAFPTPHVTVEASRIKFHFYRPHYKDKIFYTASTSQDKLPQNLDCLPEAVVCHGEMQLNVSSIKSCTTLKLEGAIDGILYETSKKVCSIEKGPWPVLLCVVISVIVLATLVGILLSARKVIKSLIEQSSSYVPRSLNSTRFSGSPKLLQPEPTITCHAETGSASLLQTPEDTPTDPTTVIPTESCPERTHFPIVAPTSSSGNQLGDGYEARIKNDFEPELQPQIEGSDDGYMQRQRITDTPDISSVSDIVEIEIAPEDFASGYGPR